MTLRAAELLVQTRITDAFIEADAIDVDLLRSTRVEDGAGGWIEGEPETVFTQRFRLLPQEDGATARTNRDGESATPEYMLLGMPGSDMQRFDEFVIDKRRFRILYIDDRQYEVKGEAIYLGE